MPKDRKGIPASSLQFLKSLKENNNREWFANHKDDFLEQQRAIALFADELLRELREHDLIETESGKKSLHRIYRDTRFSPDKTPYKTNWSGGFVRATKQRRGGYYFHLEPGNNFIAGGFFAPNPADLKRIRDEIHYHALPLRNILQSSRFKQTFGTLTGEQLKKAPKGFDANHEAINLLRLKQFLVRRHFTDEQVLCPTFASVASETFKDMRPFFDYMSLVLTSDGNGATS